MLLFQQLTSAMCGIQRLVITFRKTDFIFINFWSFTVPLPLFALLNLIVYLLFFCSFLSFSCSSILLSFYVFLAFTVYLSFWSFSFIYLISFFSLFIALLYLLSRFFPLSFTLTRLQKCNSYAEKSSDIC